MQRPVGKKSINTMLNMSTEGSRMDKKHRETEKSTLKLCDFIDNESELP